MAGSAAQPSNGINGTFAHQAAAFQPDVASLRQLGLLLEKSQQPSTDQRLVLDQLEQQRNRSDFNKYLAYLFAYGEDISEVVRSIHVLRSRAVAGALTACACRSAARCWRAFQRQGLRVRQCAAQTKQ
jgi:hypothetical protein